MAVRTSYVGTQSAGDVLTSANFTKLPGGWIGYNEVTANQSGIGAGPVDLTSLSVTVTVGTSRRIRISASTFFSLDSGSNVTCNIYIRESTTTLVQRNFTIIGTGYWEAPDCWVVLTPSSGSHTYKLSAGSSTGITLAAAATYPASILVEDIGPAS